ALGRADLGCAGGRGRWRDGLCCGSVVRGQPTDGLQGPGWGRERHMSDVRGVRGDESLPGPFIPLEGVQEVLSISRAQAYALVRSGELRAIQVGGRGQWRVEEAELEAYIERQYAEVERAIRDGVI